MLEFNKRQKKTFKYLSVATVICWASLFLVKFYPSFELLIIFVPLIFGLALNYSNKDYLKNQSSIVIPFLFALVYFWGTLPFYNFSRILFESKFLDFAFGCMSAFILVFLVTKLTLKNIQIGYYQILLIITSPFLCIRIIYFLLEVPPASLLSNAHIVVLFYQIFMTIIIISSMKEVIAAEKQTKLIINKKYIPLTTPKKH